MKFDVKALQLAIESRANKHKQAWLDYVREKLNVDKKEIRLCVSVELHHNRAYLNVDFIVAYPHLINDDELENFIYIFKSGDFKDTPIQSENLSYFYARIGVKIHREYNIKRNISVNTINEIYQMVYNDFEKSLANIQDAIYGDFVYKAKLKQVEIKKVIEKLLEMYNAEAYKSDLRQVDDKKYEFDFNVVFKAVTTKYVSDTEIRNRLNYSFDKDFNELNIRVNLFIDLQKETQYVIDNDDILLIIESVWKEFESIFKPEIAEVKQCQCQC